MSDLDSTAVFMQKLAERGLEDLGQNFADQGWCTQGDFAFAGNYTPGLPGQDDSAFQAILVKIMPDPKDTRESTIRRLH